MPKFSGEVRTWCGGDGALHFPTSDVAASAAVDAAVLVAAAAVVASSVAEVVFTVAVVVLTGLLVGEDRGRAVVVGCSGDTQLPKSSRRTWVS